MIHGMKKFKRSAVVMLTALSIVFSSLVSALVITAEQDTAWDGTIAKKYESGAGNETDPYIIKTAGQLARLINDTDTAGKYYKLSNDITVNEKLTDSALPWYSVAVENGTDAVKGAVFAGHFDGNGHTVSGLYFKGNATDNTYWYAAGLFPRAVERGVARERREPCRPRATRGIVGSEFLPHAQRGVGKALLAVLRVRHDGCDDVAHQWRIVAQQRLRAAFIPGAEKRQDLLLVHLPTSL